MGEGGGGVHRYSGVQKKATKGRDEMSELDGILVLVGGKKSEYGQGK